MIESSDKRMSLVQFKWLDQKKGRVGNVGTIQIIGRRNKLELFAQIKQLKGKIR
jgi:hypothetical protein